MEKNRPPFRPKESIRKVTNTFRNPIVRDGALLTFYGAVRLDGASMVDGLRTLEFAAGLHEGPRWQSFKRKTRETVVFWKRNKASDNYSSLE